MGRRPWAAPLSVVLASALGGYLCWFAMRHPLESMSSLNTEVEIFVADGAAWPPGVVRRLLPLASHSMAIAGKRGQRIGTV